MIRAENVSVVFRRLVGRPIRALDGLDLSIGRGDVYGLLGPNGAGKSTAMYCFLGLIRPDRGRVTVMGEAPEPGAGFFERAAYVPEEPHYHLYLTVRQAVRYYADLYRTPVARARADEAIERVGLAEFADLPLEKCSKGMKQKTGIATCLLKEPEIVFLDEPTRGLDPIIVKEVRDILLAMSARGATIVVNSHVLSEVEMICTRIGIMNRGRVVKEDRIESLLTEDRERYAFSIERGASPLPAFCEVAEGPASPEAPLKGFIPADRAEELFAFARSSGVKVLECSFKRLTLEEAFMGVMAGEEKP